MGKIQLCLLDCTSIQRFVFGSNKLKTNIGASQIVENIYKKSIPQALKEIGQNDAYERFETWKKWRSGRLKEERASKRETQRAERAKKAEERRAASAAKRKERRDKLSGSLRSFGKRNKEEEE